MTEEELYELDKNETLRRLATSKMKMTLVYATKPDLKPLGFVKDPDDVLVLVRQKLSDARGRATAALEAQGKDGGTVSSMAIRRWESARWIVVELDPDAPEPNKED